MTYCVTLKNQEIELAGADDARIKCTLHIECDDDGVIDHITIDNVHTNRGVRIVEFDNVSLEVSIYQDQINMDELMSGVAEAQQGMDEYYAELAMDMAKEEGRF